MDIPSVQSTGRRRIGGLRQRGDGDNGGQQRGSIWEPVSDGHPWDGQHCDDQEWPALDWDPLLPKLISARATAEPALAQIYIRLLPFAGLSHFLAYVDRINVSFAELTMRDDLQMSASAYGFALPPQFVRRGRRAD